MRIKILGSNGWYSTKTGNTICLLIESQDHYLVLDAGDGIQKLDQYLKSNKPIFLFLSHFHFDHICGLHVFNKFRFNNKRIKEIRIFGQPGTKKILNQIINIPYTMPFDKLGLKISVNELKEGLNQGPKLPFKVECRYLDHWSPCFGYRFYLDQKVIASCLDTGVCDNLKKLAQGADVLISECSLKSSPKPPYGLKTDKLPHLDPKTIAKIAKGLEVKRLLLVHFDANIYQTIKERREAEKTAQTIFPQTKAGFDGLEINV